MHLLYITFGKNATIHSQAAFSVYTFLAQNENITSINIITDSPDYYEHIKDRVRIVKVSRYQLQEWKGPHNFFWRIKIKGLEWICREYAGEEVMYLDTDTFLFQPLSHLQQRLKDGFALMHEDEGILSESENKTERNTWRQIKNKIFGGLVMNGQQRMWNAGVVATPNTKDAAEFTLSLNLCDELCSADVPRRLIEQFSLSTALQHVYGLKPSHTAIAHYWSNKAEWDSRISAFFTAAHLKGLTVQKAIENISSFDFKSIPIKKRSSNAARRWHQLIEHLFKQSSADYI